MTKPGSALPPGLSTYLDLLRFSAAMLVFLSHLSWNKISGGFLWQMQAAGHYGVLIFFVLSGYVIQYVTDTKEKTFLDYQVARFARLYSVVLPALLLTLVFDQIGIAQDPARYELAREADPLLRLVASGLFLSQSWGWDLYALGNDPFWSLPYEFWYYQIFAALFFLKGPVRLALVAVACLLSGPPILIYLPLWLAGVAAYRLSQTVKIPSAVAIAIFIASLAGIGLVIAAQYRGLFPRTTVPYWPTNFSVNDFLIGIFVAANLASARFIDFQFGVWAKPIAAGAGISFSLYLLHLPLLRMVSAYLPPDLSVPIRALLLFVIVLLAVIALSFVTERRKREWRTIFRALFSGFKRA